MSRVVVSGLALALAVLASCAAISGLADKEAVDCPGGCLDGAAPPRPTSTSPDGSEPVVDGGTQDAVAEPSFVKPDGWELVAVAESANGAPAPACPDGFDEASDVGTNPSATANTCACDACTVTQQATCGGQPTMSRGDDATCTNAIPNFVFTNIPAGGCNGDMTNVDRTGDFYKVKLDPATGGACNPGPPSAHPERVDFVGRRRVCDETARCSANVCDATVPAPFVACVASAKGSGDVPCPAGFPNRLVVGGASVTCATGDCSCTVGKTCTGTFTFYKDSNCTMGAVSIVADDTCRNGNLSGSYARYRVTSTPTTTCAGSGTSGATVVPKDVRTICCR